ncbi:hypothetical protein V2J09_012604 [Rumex salicifolius]
MASSAAVPFWRAAGMTYITYSNICANLVRNCLKEPLNLKPLPARRFITLFPNGRMAIPRNPPANRFVFIGPLKSVSIIHLPKLFYVAQRFCHFNCNAVSLGGFPESRGRISLNSQLVQSSLTNCQADLVVLSLFLWCARQRNYFHDRHAFVQMINVLIRLIQRFESIDGVVRELEKIGCVTRPQTLLHLIRICWQGGMDKLILDALDTMGRYGFTINTFAFNVVMDIMFKSGQNESALRCLGENTAPNFLSFNIALCNLCKLNDLVNIRVVLQKMLRAGYYPNVDTFVMMLNCWCKFGRLKEAFELLGLMVSLGIHVSVVVWSILIDGVCRLGIPDLADCMLEKMISLGCTPNVMTYTSIVKGYMECKEVTKAFRILRTMESRRCEIDVVLCNVLIHCLSKLKLYDEALDIFYELRKRKLEPDAHTFSSLVSTLCSSGRFSLLPKLLSYFNCPADLVVLNSLLSYFCKAGFAISAVNFFRDMVDREFTLDNYSYAGLITGLSRTGKTDQAVNLYKGMLAEGFEFDAHIHTLIVSELIRAGKYERALSLFREAVLKQYPVDSVSYAVAVRGLVRSGRVQEAFSLYNKMKGIGFNPDAHTANMVLSGFCKQTDLNMVKQLLIDMFDSRVELYSGTCKKLLNVMNNSRDYHSVFSLLLLMVDSGLLPQKAIDALLNGLPGPDVEKAEKPKLASNGFHEAKSVQSIPSVKNLESVAPLPINLKPPPLERHKSFDDSFSSKSSHVSALAPLAPKKEVLIPSNVKSYSIEDLQMATESFSEKGQSMGCVYRAEFDDGKVLAVKKVDAAVISNCLEDFTEIVANISRLHHPNVSELVGYCSEHEQHLLVYEFHKNGSLFDFLHLPDEYSKPLSWNTRVMIALGSARALEYLHEVCSPSVVHKNFKSENILLDGEMNPHVSDCGLSNLVDDANQCMFQYSMKSVVYSFGVVMLELLTGRKPSDSSRARREQSLVRWVTPQLHDIDALTKMPLPVKSLSRFADVIALCVQAEPEFRPPMSEVVQALVRLVQRANMSKRTNANTARPSENSEENLS